MDKERPLLEALSGARRLKHPEYSHFRPTFKEVQKTWWDISDKFDNFEEYLTSYIYAVSPRWIAAAEILSRLSNKELGKLKGIQPRPDYLAKYKLITLVDRTPKPGDAFIDLVTGEGPAFVWSPLREKTFKKWRKTNTDKRNIVHVTDIASLYAGDKIDNLERFIPNLFIKEVISRLQSK